MKTIIDFPLERFYVGNTNHFSLVCLWPRDRMLVIRNYFRFGALQLIGCDEQDRTLHFGTAINSSVLSSSSPKATTYEFMSHLDCVLIVVITNNNGLFVYIRYGP
jgi:hypothetical protein